MRKQKKQNFPVLFLAAGGLLLLLAAVVLIAQNGASQAVPTLPVSSAQEEETYPEIARVSLAEAKAALDAGSAVFLDVRDPEPYAANHISGALNIPLGELETRQKDLDPNQWIITYCT